MKMWSGRFRQPLDPAPASEVSPVALRLDGNSKVVLFNMKLDEAEPITMEAYVSVSESSKVNPTHILGNKTQFGLFIDPKTNKNSGPVSVLMQLAEEADEARRQL